jgi:hypothetical protein
MQNFPDRCVTSVVISGRIITANIWISAHHGRCLFDCRTLESAVESEDQQVSDPNFQLYGVFDKRHEVTV